jgi:hypothetical protein
MADNYESGMAFRDLLSKAAPYVAAAAHPLDTIGQQGVALGNAAGASVGDFLRGVVGASRPSVTVALPPATPVKAAVVAKAPAIAAAPAAAAKPAAAAAAANPLAGLGSLSFRQLIALGDVADKTTPRGATPRPPSTADVAGSQLASIYQSQFTNSLKAAGSDPAKQQAAVDAFEKKMLPIALKGNTADAAIFDGSTPGGQ